MHWLTKVIVAADPASVLTRKWRVARLIRDHIAWLLLMAWPLG